MSSGGNPLAQKVVACILIVAGVVILIVGVFGLRKAKDSADWPQVSGRILSSSVESRIQTNSGKQKSKKRSRQSRVYSHKIRYEYSVKGKTYTGSRVSYGDSESENQSRIRRISNQYSAGKEVNVYYSPSDPQECLLEPGVKGQSWFVPLFGILLCGAGGVMAFSGLRSK
ncbi:MAG: DUF3592 domain-containing protein [Planctomycetota bacterium]|nr:DUF3592 domain-containing protein [Planctomycetota bacterium]